MAISAHGWRDLVTRQVESGLSVREFCEREGVNLWTLYGFSPSYSMP